MLSNELKILIEQNKIDICHFYNSVIPFVNKRNIKINIYSIINSWININFNINKKLEIMDYLCQNDEYKYIEYDINLYLLEEIIIPFIDKLNYQNFKIINPNNFYFTNYIGLRKLGSSYKDKSLLKDINLYSTPSLILLNDNEFQNFDNNQLNLYLNDYLYMKKIFKFDINITIFNWLSINFNKNNILNN